MNFSDIKKIYEGKRVFITGHTGFKGSWLSLLLHMAGADVIGYALPPKAPNNLFNTLNLDKKIQHNIGDIRDLVKLSKTLNNFNPEYVFHLAAQALVIDSYDDPVLTYSSNVLGAVNLLESVRISNSVRSLVYVTSDKCYENQEWVWGYKESDLLGGHDPYSSSKAAAEIVFSSYKRSFFDISDSLGAASARAGNVIGGGDYSDNRIIPDCIKAINLNQSVVLRNPYSTRPWQHVLEPLSGYLLLASKLLEDSKHYGGAWNFGPSTGDVKTVKQVADLLYQHIGKGTVKVENLNTLQHEANVLQLNCDKAHHLLGWYPRWNADETIRETAFWYKAMLSGNNLEVITKSQILKFFG